jgi:hypothetical protein
MCPDVSPGAADGLVALVTTIRNVQSPKIKAHNQAIVVWTVNRDRVVLVRKTGLATAFGLEIFINSHT